MKTSIIKYLACPVCHSDFLLLIHQKTKERVIEGKLKCKRCHKSFYIKNAIALFIPSGEKQTKNLKKLRRITLKQEIPKTWLKHFSKKEFAALYKEWGWILSSIKKGKNTIHLDFATGTGRFLRNIASKTKGEIVALEYNYPTCLELQYFLKRIKKHNRVSIVCADARKMPLKNGVFNSVSTWHGLDEPKMEKAIKEAKRVLKDGGYLVASGIHYQKESKSFSRAKKHGIRFLTKEMIMKTLRDIGFSKIEHRTFFEGRWNEKGDYLPIFNDFYSTYAVRAKK
ncbi:MAG: methyltransferase domain-containing protein [Candidatus Methanomethylicaceae archaeon]